MNPARRSMRSIAAFGLLLSLSTAGAWKPSTHLYIAEEALRDALDDGQVSINILNNGEQQTPPVVRNYAVDSDVLAAIRADPRQYRAGVVGPDAYPDIATGQEVIHPGPGNPVGIDANRWLQHLWTNSRNDSGAVKAFTAGFLTHAAEDMFGHTMIDYYTKDKFTILPPTNAAAHIVLENYIGKRTPNILKFDRSSINSSNPGDYVTSDDMSIDGVKDFIYNTMIDAKPGSVLNNSSLGGGLYNGGGKEFSVPYIFSEIRGRLQRDIDEYHNHEAEIVRHRHECGTYDFFCFSRYEAELLAYQAANGVQVAYKEHWREDIDSGLHAWLDLSHEMNRDLLFPSRGIDHASADLFRDHAKQVAQAYVYDHLISMLGAPDFVGYTAGLVDGVLGSVLDALQIDYIKQLKADLVNGLIKDATGRPLDGPDGWREYVLNPEQHFDPVMALAPGHSITIADANTNLLHINDNQAVPDTGYAYPERRFDVQNLPAAYNSLAIAKMVLLSPAEFHRLMADLGGSASQDNAALGYINSFDGSNQWLEPLSPFRCRSVFFQVFKQQIGADPMQDGVCGPVVSQPVLCPASHLQAGSELLVSQSLYSCNGRYELRVQGDGNVVIYRKKLHWFQPADQPLWNTPNTWGHSVRALAMQTDGNLVLYDANNQPLWNTPTWGHSNVDLRMQDDGNLVIYDQGTPIWETGTH